jgi:signal transduction histidine kinase
MMDMKVAGHGIELRHGPLDDTLEHQLRNLLSIVIGYAKLMEEGMPPHDRRLEDLREILTAAEQAVALLSRDGSGS